MNDQINTLETSIGRIESGKASIESTINQLSEYRPEIEQIQNYNSVVDLMPSSVKASLPKDTLQSLSEVRSVDDLWNKIHELDNAMNTLASSRDEMIQANKPIPIIPSVLLSRPVA